MRSKLLFGVVGASCVGVMWLLAHLYRLLLEFSEQAGSVDPEYSWLFHLVLNLAGYGTIMGPGFLLYKYLQKINYFDKISLKPPTCLSRTLYACFGPYERLGEGAGGAGAGRGRDEGARGGAELAFCFTGLMGTYLVWGLLQEKIMTQSYVLSDGRAVRFTDSTLLVLCNRLGALVAALVRLSCTRRPLLAAPLYVFSYCALTNVLSAWCQYEALKYVSFPTQVLSKSCKVIPVMLMGKLISRNKYELYEYVTAALISLGMVMFMFGSHEDYSPGTVGGLGGFVLLALYLCCDSFTSSWQGALFTRYELHPLQMLAAVNLCSCALTAAALLPRPAHLAHDDDLQVLQHPGFLVDCLVLSLSSALGQLLIYRTIASFGAVVFAIIMTCRQAVSILLSCLVYGHAVSWSGRGGVALVLGGVLLRLYAAQRRRAAAARRATPATIA